jgi:biotin synthase-related radical SAM superfamily protein
MMHVRLSSGTHSLLGLSKTSLDVSPTTLYFLLGEKCYAACKYCSQQKGRYDFLSRVRWPRISLDKIISILPSTTARRICIQTLKYPRMINDLLYLVDQLHHVALPLSICVNPLPSKDMRLLKTAGVERIGIGLDCANQKLFQLLKQGVGTWKNYLSSAHSAQDIFGKVTVHLIVGLGETDYDLLSLMDQLHNGHISTALFAHTPCGLSLPPPSLERYRIIQLARYLLLHRQSNLHDMTFIKGRLVSLDLPNKNHIDYHAFLTSGCPHCNRPFYNEPVSGPLYNYPRSLTQDEQTKAIRNVSAYLHQGKILIKRAI